MGYGWLIVLGVLLAFAVGAVVARDNRWKANMRAAALNAPPLDDPSRRRPAAHFESPNVIVRAWTEIKEVKPDLPSFGTVEGPAYQIEYTDADGVVTERVIQLQDVRSEFGSVYIDAYCLLARDKRTFRADRIQRLYDHRTGQPISRPIQFFLGSAAEPEPKDNGHTLVMGRARPGLAGLIWIARADGSLSDEAIRVILDYVEARRHLPGARASELEWDRDFARRRIETERPTFDNAMGAVGRMRRGGNEAKLFRDFAEKLPRSTASHKRKEKVLRALI